MSVISGWLNQALPWIVVMLLWVIVYELKGLNEKASLLVKKAYERELRS